MNVIVQTPFESLNKILKETLPSILSTIPNIELQLIVKSEWGSESPHNRELLKEYRNAHQGEFLYSSISHCRNLGILVFSNHPIGIDIEESNRANLSVVGRISSHEEMQELELSNIPACNLWCAKEASYKSLQGFYQPAVVSALTIDNWTAYSDFYQFRLQNLNDFNKAKSQIGWVYSYERWTLSAFMFLK